MKRTINFSDFCDEFRRMDRQDSFTYEGKKAIFEWLEAVEQDTGEEIELDVIAICCDFNELTTDEVISEYSKLIGEVEEGTDKEELVKDFLYEHTTLIGDHNGNFVFQCF